MTNITVKPQALERISLIGMPGSGKTTIGPLLAARLGWDFVDMDELIEALAGCDIKTLFEQGEPVFRLWESRACRKLADYQATVVACGGGVVLRQENLPWLKQRGAIIFLDRPLEIIREDIKTSQRPLLQKGTDALTKLYKQREELYKAATPWRVTNAGEISEILDQLMDIIRQIKEVTGGSHDEAYGFKRTES